MANISIKPCTCEHKYQDKVYGKHQRVWNVGVTKLTCTVCGTQALKIGGKHET